MRETMAETLAKDRRLVVLRRLNEASGNQLNTSILRKLIAQVGHPVGDDMVRQDVRWLEEFSLVRIEELPISTGELWVVHLTALGQEVAEGRPHVGVAKPRLS